jgi:hypothetical protein
MMPNAMMPLCPLSWRRETAVADAVASQLHPLQNFSIWNHLQRRRIQDIVFLENIVAQREDEKLSNRIQLLLRLLKLHLLAGICQLLPRVFADSQILMLHPHHPGLAKKPPVFQLCKQHLFFPLVVGFRSQQVCGNAL